MYRQKNDKERKYIHEYHPIGGTGVVNDGFPIRCDGLVVGLTECL